jgi:tetratricopeptide (TPR) repeat protein
MIRRLAFIPILTVIGLTWGAGLAAAAAEETPAQLAEPKGVQEEIKGEDELNRLGKQALACMQAKNYEQALELYQQALRLTRNNEMVYYNLGKAYAYLGRYPEAEQALKEAIRLKPDLPQAHTALGWVYLRQDRLSEAQEELQEAIRLEPYCAQAHFLHTALGWVCLRQNRVSDAKEQLQEAIRCKPGFLQAHFLLGAVYLEQKDFPAAMQQYDIIKESDSNLANQLMILMEKAKKETAMK